MSLDGNRLKTSLQADILSQLQSAFPVNASLLTAEKTALNTAQQSLANAIANAVGPDAVTEVKNATVLPGTFSNSGGPVAGAGTLT
jgi:hypothetical protein